MKKQLEVAESRPVKLHNVKFYNLTPRAIHCMALNHAIKKLALTRADTTIEIWDLRTTPFMERTIVGTKKGSVEAMCWVGSELLTAGLSGQITQWDLNALRVKQTLMVTGSSIWCMDSHGGMIAAGTEEGYLNICDLDTEMESLTYNRILDKQDGRILCCKFDKTGQHLVTGSVDVLRVWDVRSGHVIHKMTTARTEKRKETVIWSILVMADLQIASADSRGRLTFWDGRVGAQLESHQSLKADALCLAVDEAEQRIFVSGIEPIICSYNITTIKKENGEVRKWVKTNSYYPHTHDVKAVVVRDSSLISGGMDGYLCITAYSTPEKFTLTLGPLLQKPSSILTDNRMILFKYPNYLELWRLGASADKETADDKNLALTEKPVKLIELLSRNEELLVSVSISPNGKWLTYSTEKHIRLFLLQGTTGNEEKPELHVIKPHIPDHYSSAALSLFSPDSKHLFLYKTSGELTIFELFEENQEIDFKQNIALKKHTSDLVHLMEVSKCGKYLVLASLSNNVVIFIKGTEKVGRRSLTKWQHHMTLPQYNYPAATLTVHPKETNQLVVTYTNNKMIVYDMDELEFTFSMVLQKRRLPAQNVVCDPERTDKWLLQDEKAIVSVTRNDAIKEGQNGDGPEDVPHQKQKRGRAEKAVDQKRGDTKYTYEEIKLANHIAHLSWLGNDELVSVELRPEVLLEQLPPTMKLKKYGTG